MKIISFVIPSYNSEAYLHQAVDSLLVASQDIEIIIVNDGSKDHTIDIAKAYEKKHPSIIKIIDQHNGGHGSTINAGLKIASGLFFKVIDSDDWVDQECLITFINTLKKHMEERVMVDLYITNFMYEHASDNTQFERDYSSNFPANVVFNWDELRKKFKNSKTLLMHALTYRTSLLREIKLELPRHTFYVDNLVSYLPLPFVKRIYYMNIPLYRYFIGRADQSITLKNITNRYQQQILVQKIMMHAYSFDNLERLPRGLRDYMKHSVSAIMMITQMFTVAQDSKERRVDLKELWLEVKRNDVRLYRFLKYRSMNVLVTFLPWRIKRFVMVKGYMYLAKKIKLG